MPPDLLTFRWVALSEALAAGVEDLLQENWEEAETAKDEFVLQPDWPSYQMYERQGMFRAVGAFHQGKLVGYSAWMVQPMLRFKGRLWALNDTTYLLPAYRRGSAGVRLVKAALALLKEAGVERVLHGDKVRANSPSGKTRASFGDILLRLGFSLDEKVYAKTL